MFNADEDLMIQNSQDIDLVDIMVNGRKKSEKQKKRKGSAGIYLQILFPSAITGREGSTRVISKGFCNTLGYYVESV